MIQRVIEQYVFTAYADRPTLETLSAADLNKLTRGGLNVCKLIAEAFPTAGGELSVGGAHIFNNLGFERFIDSTRSWAAPIVRQGFAPVLEDSGGNLIFLPVSDVSLEPVMTASTDEVWESDDIMDFGAVYDGSLYSIVENTLKKSNFNMFEHTKGTTNHDDY